MVDIRQLASPGINLLVFFILKVNSFDFGQIFRFPYSVENSFKSKSIVWQIFELF